ncbi:hypothetical protein H6G00_13345 [Leptolyngbya sp. FACHB-541]|uniref:hypothetical protein n=1 Tax=Leptolyngbya sp. FACHB-541 TaxID=2692810 RepID=UPI001689781F|nr:hypothetical protein [Leptolyngbya sp. FACHB-541]MBD1997599.1 hypothetical protein [Leptolyngbya sp. FACHB-541]
MALFILFALLIGLIGSIVIGTPGILLLITKLQQHTGSQRCVLAAYCGMGATLTLLLTTSWSLSQFRTITPPGAGAPTPDDALALLKAWIGFGLAPGLSLSSAGLTSLCWRRK